MNPSAYPSQKLVQELAQTFGFHSFHPHQEDIIQAILQRQDVFGVMPTGGGKSLCFQLPAKLMSGVCVVVSPLISLMKDQVDAARTNGLRAATLNSTVPPIEKRNIEDALRNNELDLLYISPERFNNDYFVQWLAQLNIAFFAIDEAHCISEWGHDFRPDYLALSRIADEFPSKPLAAFTATATTRVSEDIINRLKLRSPLLVRASFNRPNLFYHVEQKYNINEQLRNFLAKHPKESGIVYRQSRKKVEDTAAMLQYSGYSALPYHAGMSDVDRHHAQDAFSKDECSIIVATIAFGMGINKSNVRFVIHGDLPKNIESYYQETGRAGRDGEPADCVLFFGQGDLVLLKTFAKDIEDPDAREIAFTQLGQIIHFAQSDDCRRAALLKYFGENYPQPNCGNCDFCNNNIEREDATIPAQKILSAVYRTGEKFGAAHICDVVFGANTEKIRQFHHEQLPTYGVGKDRKKTYWRSLFDALVNQQILTLADASTFDGHSYSVPKLTEEAWKILKGKRSFQMIKYHEKTEKRAEATDLPALSPFGRTVFNVLRELRLSIARDSGLPPFVVFSDRTLHELALYLPENDEGILLINGVGQHKRELYGEQFLAAIRKCCDNEPAAAETSRKVFKVSKKPAVNVAEKKQNREITLSIEETLMLYKQGKTIAEIAALRNLTEGTIIMHIEQVSQSGFAFESSRFFTAERLAQMKEWFQGAIREAQERGLSYLPLKPAVEASNGQLDYEEAKLARIFLT